MEVFVRMPTESVSSYDINQHTTVGALKRMIAEDHGLNSKTIELTYDGVVMKSKEKVISSGLISTSEIQLSVSKRGSAIAKLGYTPTHQDLVDHIEKSSPPLVSTVKLLLDAGCSVHVKSLTTASTPLHAAARKGLPLICLLLLKADDTNKIVNYLDGNEETPLYAAVEAYGKVLPLPSPNYMATIRMLLSVPGVNISQLVIKFPSLFQSQFLGES
eukprot:TRINITY_DN6336_c0_g1_i2.p1 TRINITY_DN6336_c0_g1~~TRINITY_DN6336_c0_g1_i2.p1  ORF type:complete len:216 (+),score=38.17 TRINITY_DN6336_c0_g1_i2:37-684(+)